VAVTGVTTQKTVVDQGYPLPINVTVENRGDYQETFNVTAYANTTLIQTQPVFNLAPGNETTLTFTWNTTGVSLGNYTIKAEVSAVPGETYATDNVKIDGMVNVVLEFPSFLIMPLFMMATLLAVIVYRRKTFTRGVQKLTNLSKT
jgi:hypothetical protein